MQLIRSRTQSNQHGDSSEVKIIQVDERSTSNKRKKKMFRITKGKIIFICALLGVACFQISMRLDNTFPDLQKSSLEPPPRDITVGVATMHYFGEGFYDVKDCKVRNQPFKCNYVKAPHKNTVDVKLYHAPHTSMQSVRREKETQLLAMISMEPAGFYPIQENPEFLNKFDIIQYYKWDSHIPILYSDGFLKNGVLFKPVIVPSIAKENALVYMNSNCYAKNDRNAIVNGIMGTQSIPVHNYGACLNNKPRPTIGKIELFSKYKFCIAMENSNGEDYVSEKLWQSLEAGCLPIYYGAPNIDKFLPAPAKEMILNYADFGSPKAMADELVRLIANPEEYDKFFEWKKIDPEKDKLREGFQWLMTRSKHDSNCDFCRHVLNLLETRVDVEDLSEQNEKNTIKLPLLATEADHTP